MAEILRTADAVWQGDLRSGKGLISAASGVLKDAAYTHAARYENAPGTNPEELIAAAHAACFTMALNSTLGKKGYQPQTLRTHATLTMERGEGGTNITKIRLEVEGEVPNIDQATFAQIADEAERGCPVSRLLRPGLKEVEVAATLK